MISSQCLDNTIQYLNISIFCSTIWIRIQLWPVASSARIAVLRHAHRIWHVCRSIRTFVQSSEWQYATQEGPWPTGEDSNDKRIELLRIVCKADHSRDEHCLVDGDLRSGKDFGAIKIISSTKSLKVSCPEPKSGDRSELTPSFPEFL